MTDPTTLQLRLRRGDSDGLTLYEAADRIDTLEADMARMRHQVIGLNAKVELVPLTPSQKDSERATFEQWYVENAFNYERDPIGSKLCGDQWAAWKARATHPPEPAQQAAVLQKYLKGGMRFKISGSKKWGAELLGLPTDLIGQWVAFVDATDNEHMLSAAPSTGESNG